MLELIAQSQNPQDSMVQLEPWKTALNDFLQANKTWNQDQHREAALLFVDRLSEV